MILVLSLPQLLSGNKLNTCFKNIDNLENEKNQL